MQVSCSGNVSWRQGTGLGGEEGEEGEVMGSGL